MCLEELGVDPDAILISNKLAWKRTPLLTPEPTFEPGAWVNIKHDAKQDISYQGMLDCYEEGNALLGKYQAKVVSVSISHTSAGGKNCLLLVGGTGQYNVGGHIWFVELASTTQYHMLFYIYGHGWFD